MSCPAARRLVRARRRVARPALRRHGGLPRRLRRRRRRAPLRRRPVGGALRDAVGGRPSMSSATATPAQAAARARDVVSRRRGARARVRGREILRRRRRGDGRRRAGRRGGGGALRRRRRRRLLGRPGQRHGQAGDAPTASRGDPAPLSQVNSFRYFAALHGDRVRGDFGGVAALAAPPTHYARFEDDVFPFLDVVAAELAAGVVRAFPGPDAALEGPFARAPRPASSAPPERHPLP